MATLLSRRSFVAGAAAVLLPRKVFTQSQINQRIEIDCKAEIGLIRPELHGHFAEHLGSCIYGGLWVGRNSPIPNIDGCRRQAVEYLKQLGVPVLRWPGGCFADDYHWREGIGAPEKRPRTVNIHWGGYTEDNSFGTHEFIRLCRLIGAEPYLAGNLGSGTPEELRDWVEYCNYPQGSSLAEERARNGSAEPFRVRYWGVGNENWGCGGSMTPEEYAGHYRRFSTYLRTFGDTRPFLIACGPGSNDLDWTRRFFEARGRGFQAQGYTLHYYQRTRQLAVKYTPQTMQQQFAAFEGMERAIAEQRALMDKYDPQRRIGLLVDEWGIWDDQDPEDRKRYGNLFQQIPMRSGVGAALGLNVFHRQADKLVMCNIAQTVNVLHAMLLTYEEKCIRTPAYYAFELAKPHRDKTSVRANVATTPVLSVSASRSEREIAVTLVNPRPDTALPVECALSGATVSSATARLLHHPDLNACNTFEQPDLIVPKPHPVEVTASRLRLELPPLSVATVVGNLA
jgi:alpha-N-arabinofuranosidase